MDVDYDGAEYDSARGTMQEGPSQNLDESLPGTKLYANPEYEVPLTPDELAARQKRAERFARFGMPEAAPAVPPELAPAPAPLESYTQLRPNALHVQSDSIQSMDTSAILRWATTFVRKDQLKGLEWIDDVSGCLVFTDPHAAAAGMHGLLQDSSTLSALGSALGRLEDIYSEPAPADLEAVATPQRAHALEGQTPAWIRFALIEDKKSKNARNQSRYYAEHAPPKVAFEERRGHTGPTQEDLDAELDAYTAGEEYAPRRPGRGDRAAGGGRRRRGSPRGQRDEEMDRLDRYEGRHQTAQARTKGLADLDAELDAYLGSEGGSTSTSAQTSQQQQRSGEPVELFPSLAGFRSDALKQTPTPISWGAVPQAPSGSLAQRIGGQAPAPELFPSQRASATDLFNDEGRTKPAPSSSGGMRGWAD